MQRHIWLGDRIANIGDKDPRLMFLRDMIANINKILSPLYCYIAVASHTNLLIRLSRHAMTESGYGNLEGSINIFIDGITDSIMAHRYSFYIAEATSDLKQNSNLRQGLKNTSTSNFHCINVKNISSETMVPGAHWKIPTKHIWPRIFRALIIYVTHVHKVTQMDIYPVTAPEWFQNVDLFYLIDTCACRWQLWRHNDWLFSRGFYGRFLIPMALGLLI